MKACRLLPTIAHSEMPSVRVVASIGESVNTSIGRGWYKVTVNGLSPDQAELRLRLDVGRGFSEHHSIGVWHAGSSVSAVARLFKHVHAVQPAWTGGLSEELPLEIRFERLSPATLLWRRTIELFGLVQYVLKKWRADRFHHENAFLRYLRWRDMFSFPLRMGVHSVYDEWILRDELLTSHRRAKADGCSLPVIVVCHDEKALSVAAAEQCEAICHWPPDDDPKELNELLNLYPEAWILFVEPGYQLHSGAIDRLREELGKGDFDLAYGDHDWMDADGHRLNPHYQFGFSIDRLRAEDWLGPVVALAGDAIRETGYWPKEEWKFGRWQVAQRIAERAGEHRVRHIPKILAHAHPQIWRNGPPVPATIAADQSDTHCTFITSERPLVSIIIPTKDKVGLLSSAVGSILKLTRWDPFEVIIIDHESREEETLRWFADISQNENVRIISYEGPFNFSAMNNEAAKTARGEILAFLNNDVEVLSPDWMHHLASAAARDDIGCAGGMLLYPDGTVQHDGISLGIGGVGAHAQCGFSASSSAPNLALAQQRNVAAVTGACLFVKASLFNKLGGFDAENLPVAFNDIDLSLRARQLGLRNIWLPGAQLIHHESATRKADGMNSSDLRFMRELRYIRDKWGPTLDNDPYYSVNFDLRRSGLAIRL